MKTHWSSCGIYNGPAYAPSWCTCEGMSLWRKVRAFVRMTWLYYTGQL